MTLPLPTGGLDLWTILVGYTFGGFWITVIALMLVMFLIMGWLGRISIYSCLMYLTMFVLCMSLGFGYTLLSLLITVAIIVWFYFSWKGYIDKAGQG